MADLNMLADTATERAQEEQRKSRLKSIDLHNRLLMHSSDCFDANCPSATCRTMKNLIRHKCCGKQCSTGRRMGALIYLHAFKCSKSRCSVLKCRQAKAVYARQAAIGVRFLNRAEEDFQA